MTGFFVIERKVAIVESILTEMEAKYRHFRPFNKRVFNKMRLNFNACGITEFGVSSAFAFASHIGVECVRRFFAERNAIVHLVSKHVHRVKSAVVVQEVEFPLLSADVDHLSGVALLKEAHTRLNSSLMRRIREHELTQVQKDELCDLDAESDSEFVHDRLSAVLANLENAFV